MTMTLDKKYIEQRNGSYYIIDTRISLASVVYAYQDGHSPEGIQECFPLLTLEQIHGALAFYLGNREEIDNHLVAQRESYEQQRQAARATDPAFYERMAARRRGLLAES
jgi:uncharacterized protein (DUF433 family)